MWLVSGYYDQPVPLVELKSMHFLYTSDRLSYSKRLSLFFLSFTSSTSCSTLICSQLNWSAGEICKRACISLKWSIKQDRHSLLALATSRTCKAIRSEDWIKFMINFMIIIESGINLWNGLVIPVFNSTSEVLNTLRLCRIYIFLKLLQCSSRKFWNYTVNRNLRLSLNAFLGNITTGNFGIEWKLTTPRVESLR